MRVYTRMRQCSKSWVLRTDLRNRAMIYNGQSEMGRKDCVSRSALLVSSFPLFNRPRTLPLIFHLFIFFFIPELIVNELANNRDNVYVYNSSYIPILLSLSFFLFFLSQVFLFPQ